MEERSKKNVKVVTDKELYEIVMNEVPHGVEEIEVDMGAVIGVGGESIVLNVGTRKVVKMIQIRQNAQEKRVERVATGKVQSKYVLEPLEFTIQCLKEGNVKTTFYLFGEYICVIMRSLST